MLWMLSYILLGVLALIILLVVYMVKQELGYRKYYKERNIFYLGNGIMQLINMVLKGTSFTEDITQTYTKIKKRGLRFAVGRESGLENYILVDLELIKLVMVKDFDHFVDRRTFVKSGKDNLLEKSLLSVGGEEWKALRAIMSPTFTSGKIKNMFEIMERSGKEFVKFTSQDLQGSPTGEIDLRKGFAKYALNFIASAAFAIDSKSFAQSGPSEFEKMAAQLDFKMDVLSMLKFVFMSVNPPWVNDLFGFSFFPKTTQDFFRHAIKSTIRHREKEAGTVKRVDFIQLLLEARAGQLKTEEGDVVGQFEKDQEIRGQVTKAVSLEDEDIVAQSVLFILAGFQTMQASLLFAAYHLALHPELQNRLYEEVRNYGEVSYETVNQMEYLDMFMSESLRVFSPGVITERICTSDYKIPDSDVVIQKGSLVSIPIYTIQRDEEYFPQPEKFDPERFSKENKSNIVPYSYMPFGLGPRSCIAMRLALVEVKVAIVHLLLNFRLEPCEKTPIPMKFAKSGTLTPEGGLWLKLHPRK